MTDKLESYEQMFTEYANPLFKVFNEDEMVFVNYGIYWDCYSNSDLEEVLDDQFGKFMNIYEIGNGLKAEDQDELLEKYNEYNLNSYIEKAMNNETFEIGNEQDRDNYIQEWMEDVYGVSDFLDVFYNYMDWNAIISDFEYDLGIREFNERFYCISDF